MQTVKKYFGFFWILIGIVANDLLVYSAAVNIDIAKPEVNKMLPWVIILAVSTPISFGLILFGWYALKGEYAASPNPSGGGAS